MLRHVLFLLPPLPSTLLPNPSTLPALTAHHELECN